MKTKKITILNILATILLMGVTAHADEAEFIMTCQTPPNVDSNYQIQFFVDELGVTELFLKSAMGAVIGYDRSFDYSGGYALLVEGEFIGSRYNFNSTSGRLEDARGHGATETFICR